MEEAQERKKRFVVLLERLLDQCEGVKGKLAQKLNIKPSTLTPWLQGKIDPASLEILVFNRIAKVAARTPDSLAQSLKIIEIEKQQKVSQEQLQNLIKQMLVTQSREQLGMRLGISSHTVSNWLNPERNVHPEKIPVGTFAAVALERGWTIERLLAYLNLNKDQEIEEDILALIQSQTKQLSLPNRIKLLSWLSADFEKELSNLNVTKVNTRDEKILSDQKICILLEQDDVAIASDYFTNFAKHLQLQPENIKIATPSSIPDSLEDFDILILDINSPQSPCISLLDSLEFEGDILVFADSSLTDNVRERLSELATKIIVKPVPWGELKDKNYFLE